MKAWRQSGQGQVGYHLAALQQLINRDVLQVGKGKIVKVSGIQDKGKTATVLLRGSNKLVLEEAERSLHDALCVIRCLVHKRALIAGGAAPEVEMTTQLSKWAKELQVGARLVLLSPSGSEAVTPAPAMERPGLHPETLCGCGFCWHPQQLTAACCMRSFVPSPDLPAICVQLESCSVSEPLVVVTHDERLPPASTGCSNLACCCQYGKEMC